MRKGQVINIDWTVGLSLFLISSLTAVIFLTNVNIGPDRINSLESKTLEVQSNLQDVTAVEAKKIPLIVRGSEEISNIPVDRYYNFSSNAYPNSGGGDIAVELDIKENNLVAVTDSGNLTHSMVYFTDSVANATYSNDIETDNNWINNSKISMRKDSSGINSLQISGKELLNPDADLGAGDSSINESGIYAETLSGKLRAYNNSSELIIDDRTGNITFNLENLSTVYWYENDTAISLTGTGVKAKGSTKGFSIASDHGVTFIGEMTATVSKPDTSTVKAEIDAERVRVRLQNSDYTAGKKRIRFYDKGYIVIGASQKFSAPYSSKIKKLNSESENDFESSLNTEEFNYNIGLGFWIQKLVDGLSDWNQGTFNATSASRKDNSGDLGLGYRNGTQGDSLVGYWRMDRNIAGDGGTVKDYSGEGNDGTTQANTAGVTTGRTGVFSTNSFYFDGNDGVSEEEYIEINNPQNLPTSPPFTMMAWIKPERLNKGANTETFLVIGDGDTNSFEFNTNWESDELRFYQRGGDLMVGNTSMTESTWYHAAVTVDSNNDGEIYLNGELDTKENSLSMASPPQEARIGSEDGSRYFFKGNIDDVFIYDQALSGEKIKQLYLQGQDGKFNGNYTVENQTGSFQKWQEVTVKASIPSGTSLEAVFESLDENGKPVDNQTIQIQDGKNSYSIDSDSSQGYRMKFIGDSSDPEKSWEVEDYSLKYGPELKRGNIIPLDTSAVVSDRSSALIHRNGSFSEIQNRVVLWP